MEAALLDRFHWRDTRYAAATAEIDNEVVAHTAMSHNRDYVSTKSDNLATFDQGQPWRRCDMAERTSVKDLLRRGVERAHLSVDELARRSGVNRATVYRALSADEAHAPSTRTVEKLMRVLDAELGERSVYMQVTGSGVQFRADWPSISDENSEPTQGEMVLSLVQSAVALMTAFVSDALGLTEEEDKELFDTLPLSPSIVAKLAKGLGILKSPTAERIQDIILVGELVRAAGGRFPLPDEAFVSAIHRLTPAKTMEETGGAPDPFITMIGMATILVHELSQRTADVAESGHFRRKSRFS